MTLEVQILSAVALDLLVGDPRWLPHPAKLIGRGAAWLEGPMRRLCRNARVAGVVTVLVVLAAAGGGTWGLIALARLAHPLAGDGVAIVLIYTTIAARDLARHSMAVFRPLARGDLDEAGVTRAAVESVAESTVDGLTAPLLFAIVAGPVGAMLYRAINTLDSTFGYTTERYARFGWASARLDDLANYVPARLTAPLVALAAGLLGQRPIQALRILARDGRRHASPNAALAQAAMAGAMGVRVGGLACYAGEPLDKPTIGEGAVPLAPRHIVLANALMFATGGLFLALGLGGRAAVLALWYAWRAAA